MKDHLSVPILLLVVVLAWVAEVSADPPSCKTVKNDAGNTFEVCTRMDSECLSLAKEQVSNPSYKWNGCSFGATIITSPTVLGKMLVYNTHISVVPSYTDSERVDMKIMFEFSNHTHREYVRTDVPIIIRNNILSASVDIGSEYQPYGVPTLEAREKGGEKEALHIYK